MLSFGVKCSSFEFAFAQDICAAAHTSRWSTWASPAYREMPYRSISLDSSNEAAFGWPVMHDVVVKTRFPHISSTHLDPIFEVQEFDPQAPTISYGKIATPSATVPSTSSWTAPVAFATSFVFSMFFRPPMVGHALGSQLQRPHS